LTVAVTNSVPYGSICVTDVRLEITCVAEELILINLQRCVKA
jgi:hypothetical protein